jgi:hypothetical protein
VGSWGLRAQAWLVAAVAGTAGVACNASNTFTCASDQQCGGGGFCESTGFCSFPDAACNSGRRYGEHSGDLADQCVRPGDTDATSDGSTSSPDPPPPGESSSSDTTGPAISVSAGTTEEDDDTASIGGSTEASGGDSSSSTETPIERVIDGLLVLYTFGEGGGDTVIDNSGLEPSIDLTVMGEGYVWDDAGLIKTDTSGILLAEGSASKVLDACQASDEITLEAWVTPADPLPTPVPARVLTYSLDSSYRNFTLGQGQGVAEVPTEGWAVRLRTTETTVNGAPYLFYMTEVALAPTHLVFTHAADDSEALYIDAVEVDSGVRTGSFDGWDPDTMTYKLAMGNEITLDRSWNGTFHLAAIYERALDATEVQQNFDAGY